MRTSGMQNTGRIKDKPKEVAVGWEEWGRMPYLGGRNKNKKLKIKNKKPTTGMEDGLYYKC